MHNQTYFKDQIKQYFLFLYPTVILLLFNLLFFNKYFPLSEGWWETYGYLVNQGKIIYNDFYLAFPPLFVLLNAYLLTITHSFLVLRLVGVLVFCGNVILLQLLLEKFYSRQISALVTLLASFLLLSDVTFIAKDYHTFEITLTLLVLLLGHQAATTSVALVNNATIFIKFILLGCIVGLLLLVKQNIGIFLYLAYVFCILSCNTMTWTQRFLWLLASIIGLMIVASGLLIYCYHHHIEWVQITKVLFDNNSKGSATTVLTRFITNTEIRHFIIKSIFFSYLLYVIYYTSILNIFIKNTVIKEWYDRVCKTPNFMWLLILCVGIVIEKFWSPIINNYLIFCLGILIFLVIKVYGLDQKNEKNPSFKFIIIPLLALVYCNTHTAGLNSTGMFLIIAFASGFLLETLFINNRANLTLIHGIVLMFIPLIMLQKLYQPYNWWGLKQSPISVANKTLPYPETKGIYVDSNTKKAFDLINNAILQYSKSDSDVYLFPNIPIFYLLNHKIPPYKGVVQWFDVISSKDITEELKNLRRSPPNVIIFLEPYNLVYQGHRNLIHRHLTQMDFKNEFDRMVNMGLYKVSSYLINAKDTHISNLIQVPRKHEIALRNKELDQKSLEYINNFLSKSVPNGHFVIKGAICNHVKMSHINFDMIVKLNDVLVLDMDYETLNKVTPLIGHPQNEDNYILNIYHK